MLDLVLKTGMVKTEKRAAHVLMGIAILAFIISGYIAMRTLGGLGASTPTPIIYEDRILPPAIINI